MGDDDRFLSLYGGMDDHQRRAVKDAFNDSAAKVRILVATDAASEGLNLQQTARYMLHFDCPWNPMRLEQRIGRLDRHGQGRDVEVFHFTSDQSADLRFMAKVIEKVDQVREDLGSCGEVFDACLRRRMISGEDQDGVAKEMSVRVDAARELCHIEADDTSVGEADPLAPLTAAIDLSPLAMCQTLDTALAWGGLGRPQLEPVSRSGAAPGTWKLRREDVPGWKESIDSSVRGKSDTRALGAMRDLAFSADSFVVPVGELKVFRNRPDAVFVHLAHPMMRQGLQRLVRTRYPGHESISRWTVRRSPLPEGVGALLLLSIEELGVNNLRETFHHWVRTVAFPVAGGAVGIPQINRPAAEWSVGCAPAAEGDDTLASDLILDHRKELESWILSYRGDLQKQLSGQLRADQKAARDEAIQGFRSRAAELSELIQSNTVQRLEREIAEMQAQYRQRELWQQHEDELKEAIRQKNEEVERRTRHLTEMRAALEKERERVVERVIPNRYAMGTDVAVFPVTIEVRLPAYGGAR